MYLENEAPGRYQQFPYCQAVAASSCVPGLFTPLEMNGLYDGVSLRLVDGGVYDNQGIGGLLDQNCSVMLVSDASGQSTFHTFTVAVPEIKEKLAAERRKAEEQRRFVVTARIVIAPAPSKSTAFS